MKIPDHFMATDKLGRTFEYILKGYKVGTYGIMLHNVTNNTETDVEEEWFKQRDIKEI